MFFSLLGYSQVETNMNVSNSAVSTEEPEEENLEQDTVLQEIGKNTEELKDKGRTTKKISLKKEKEGVLAPGGYSNKPSSPTPAAVGNIATSPDAAGVASTQEYKSASYSFSTTKSEASIQRSQRSPSLGQQVEMDQAVDYFEVTSPNSFEFHYFKYVSGNYDVSLVKHLEEAEAIRPDNADVQVQMAAYNMIKRNKDSAIGYLDKLKAAGRLTENILHYAEDILLSVPKNGVLITHGFDDSYATWYKQKTSDIRKDVTIISLDFMQSDHYRALLKEDG